MTSKVFQLSGTCNNYPWGKKGHQSLAAQLCQLTPGTGFEIEDDKFYSEMWFGDYPDFPARKLESGETLADVLKKNKDELLGKKVVERYDAQLPFLPKILSIAKALPLQIHPNKALAAALNEKDPDKFSDSNHKPEIAVALSKFECFAGYKHTQEIARLFKQLEPLKHLDPAPDRVWTDADLRKLTQTLLKLDESTTSKLQAALLRCHDLSQNDDATGATYIPDLLPRLQEQYGDSDAGSLVALLCMNFLQLDPLEAIFIPADGIHAYLSGNIVECMARSNNVLNSGFMPREERDSIDTFAGAVGIGQPRGREGVILREEKCSRSKEGNTVVYRPPMSEFDMLRADLKGASQDVIEAGDGPAVMIVTQGHGTMQADGKTFELKEGWIFYVAPGVEVMWATETGMQIFMAVV